tara:strand:+ start:4373 stop:5920 length:1548 start_codon:yes stop_codon:yes gene_type:complete
VGLELIVDTRKKGTWLALLDEGKLIELHQEDDGDNAFSVGDVYLGKVRKVVPSLNASFVDVGYEKDAFLHYLDLGPQYTSLNKFSRETLRGKQNVADLQYVKLEKDIPKDGKITGTISASAPILVQVAKEPISSKGPRLTAEITLAGRFLVLVPFSNKVSISQKIKDSAERDRLKDVMKKIKPKNFGVIIRTVATGKKLEQLEQDLNSLVDKWKKIHENLQGAKPPTRVLGEIDKTSGILRDMLNGDFTNIHVNDDEMYDSLKSYVSDIAPGREKIVKKYTGKLDIFEKFGVNRQIKALFGRKVPMPSGGYLIIEHTEAMHVVDVNSGNRKGADGQENNALSTNLEAAKEMARVLQLRDMGGIICIDFIDMHERANNKALFQTLKDAMKTDRAKHNILPPSKFGVVEITRQRVRPQTDIITAETCPTCNGTGEVQASILLAEEIENNLDYLMKRNEKKVTLLAHPYLAAYFTKGMISQQVKWYLKYKKWISVRGLSSQHLLEYTFVDSDNEEITL